MKALISSLIVVASFAASNAEVLFSSNDEAVCEQIYAPFFLNVGDTFLCLAGDGTIGTSCTSASGAMHWNAYPLWADTLQPVGDDRTAGTDMVMHCDIDYQPAVLLPGIQVH